MPNARVVKIASKCLQKLSHLPQTPQTWRIVEKTIMWIRHFLNDFYMSHNSANSVKASKDKIVSWYIGSISCKLALKKAKKKNELKFFFNISCNRYKKGTEALGRQINWSNHGTWWQTEFELTSRVGLHSFNGTSANVERSTNIASDGRNFASAHLNCWCV